MACRSINMYGSLLRPRRIIADQSPVISFRPNEAGRLGVNRRVVLCCSAPESSSTATVTDKKEAEPAKATTPAAAATTATEKKEAEPAKAKASPAKPKKAPVKPLPEMMEEDVIPSLKATLETEEDLSQIELSFKDNRLEGSFLKKDVPYYFWAFFPDGVLTGPKGFSLSSHGSEASTVEPFLIDERKITAKHIVFWVEKRLAAQGILPVWKE
ncbi:uncharacterized protein A4U43_C05F7330 [Asparagus officinalis]|uniref:Uncharacterized protein n=1 Tax=Asparagus officinalis TaxID=4686 RepID=A0A5P1ETN7_ASPOF|nr:uncharacterized protein LOC109842885 [Asparagus officinalis]ONK68089.1 uncharacterized protein A4U43_C05F7330 [Asparagus officinalis]